MSPADSRPTDAGMPGRDVNAAGFLKDAALVPATGADAALAAEPESVAGEEDPGAAIDEVAPAAPGEGKARPRT